MNEFAFAHISNVNKFLEEFVKINGLSLEDASKRISLEEYSDLLSNVWIRKTSVYFDGELVQTIGTSLARLEF